MRPIEEISNGIWSDLYVRVMDRVALLAKPLKETP